MFNTLKIECLNLVKKILQSFIAFRTQFLKYKNVIAFISFQEQLISGKMDIYLLNVS